MEEAPLNDIDLLQERIDQINALNADELTDADIDALVANLRHMRAMKASGQKPARAKTDLAAILDIVRADPPAKTEPMFKRRKL